MRASGPKPSGRSRGRLDRYLSELAGRERPDSGEIIGLLDRSGPRLRAADRAALARAIRGAFGAAPLPEPLSRALGEFLAAPPGRRANPTSLLRDVERAGADPASLLAVLRRADEELEAGADRAAVARAAAEAFAGRDLPLAVRVAIQQILALRPARGGT